MLLFQYQSIIARILCFTIHSGFCYEEDKSFLFRVFLSLIVFERLLGPNNLFAADTVRSTTVSQKFTFFTAVIVSLNLSPTLLGLFFNEILLRLWTCYSLLLLPILPSFFHLAASRFCRNRASGDLTQRLDFPACKQSPKVAFYCCQERDDVTIFGQRLTTRRRDGRNRRRRRPRWNQLFPSWESCLEVMMGLIKLQFL